MMKKINLVLITLLCSTLSFKTVAASGTATYVCPNPSEMQLEEGTMRQKFPNSNIYLMNATPSLQMTSSSGDVPTPTSEDVVIQIEVDSGKTPTVADFKSVLPQAQLNGIFASPNGDTNSCAYNVSGKNSNFALKAFLNFDYSNGWSDGCMATAKDTIVCTSNN